MPRHRRRAAGRAKAKRRKAEESEILQRRVATSHQCPSLPHDVAVAALLDRRVPPLSYSSGAKLWSQNVAIVQSGGGDGVDGGERRRPTFVRAGNWTGSRAGGGGGGGSQEMIASR